jgi:DNA-binding beta-propeller fold protein YncE
MSAVSCSARRSFLTAAASLGATLALGARPEPARAQAPIVLGTGSHRYEWVSGWGALPGNVDYGNTHGAIVIDEAERVYLNTDTTKAVLMFDLDGRFIGSWGQEFAGGLHGMAIVRECGGQEYLYLTHTERHEVVKAKLDGTVIASLPFPQSSGAYTSQSQYKPTGVAVAPNGNVYVADGYGQSWVHQYDPAGKYVRSWGGLGTDNGKFKTPHGIWVDTRGTTPVLLVADRENGRLQVFDLDGKFLQVVTGFRRPCGFHQLGDDLVVPDLGGRVTILNKDNQVITHLGDNPDPALRAQNNVDRDKWQDGVFIAPHSARWDADGNLYVMDWNFRGRVNKLRRLD